MDDRDFPIFDKDVLFQLDMLRRMIEEIPGLLDRDDCPYPPEIISLFSAGKLAVALGDGGDGGDGGEGDIDLMVETQQLYVKLKNASATLGDEDTAEKMSYFRTATALLEKILGMKERANNVKQVGQFYRAVIGVLEEVCEPAQITQVRERLNDYLS